MNKKFYRKFYSVFFLYCLWSFVLVTHTILVSDFHKMNELFGTSSLNLHLFFYAVVTASLIIVGAILSWLSEKKNYTWASWGFVIFCGFRAIDLILGKLHAGNMNGLSTTDIYEWWKIALFIAIWLLLMALELRRNIRNKNKGHT